MQTKIIKLFALLAILVEGMLLNGGVLLGQQITKTPEPTALQSLFAEDTCAPPCWFSLIPGESSEEEVLAFLDAQDSAISVRPHHSSDDVFDPKTGELVETRYSFIWRDSSYFNPPQAILTIKDGVLYHIWTQPNREITFGEVLDLLGHPDYLHLGMVGWSTLTAIYEKPRLRILLDSRSPSSLCAIQDIKSEFRVMDISYFSMEAAQELLTAPVLQNGADPQPQLLFRRRNDYNVPKERLEQWLNGNETETCFEAWEQLHDENEMQSPEP